MKSQTVILVCTYVRGKDKKKIVKDSLLNSKTTSTLPSNFLKGIKYYITRNFLAPLHITFMVTKRCNANCIMYSVPKKADYELSIPDIRDIFSDRLFHSIEQEFFFLDFY